jgi:uncharacterized protein
MKVKLLNSVIETTRQWIQSIVVGLNLCPFARQPLQAGLVHFIEAAALDEAGLMLELRSALLALHASDRSAIETTVLIHPHVLTDFAQYNQFLDLADSLIDELDLVGEIQIASFHPDYQFAGTLINDPENYSNRSPYPMLHLLREASISQALDQGADSSAIVQRNIDTLRGLGVAELKKLLG